MTRQLTPEAFASICKRSMTRAVTIGEVKELCNTIETAWAENARLREALEFYADAETYFAIGVFADPPCGEFADDFDEAEDSYGNMEQRPGKRARAALAKEGA